MAPTTPGALSRVLAAFLLGAVVAFVVELLRPRGAGAGSAAVADPGARPAAPVRTRV